ncbi:MAG: hypothetical protein OWQ48_00790 [Desulfurococcus sp.]|nr:hypothetical protein [Desulfurococcus sp.]
MSGKLWLSLLTLLLVLSVISAVSVNAQSNETTTAQDVMNKILSNPKSYMVILVQFLLGLALGYFSLKVIKYIIALILIVVLGIALSIWSIGGDIYDFLTKIAGYSSEIADIIWRVAVALGLLTLGPITVGFIAGAILAWIKG